MKRIFTIILFCASSVFLHAQGTIGDRLPERAAWVITQTGRDWPWSSDSAEQQTQFIKILDNLQTMGIKTVVVQVRPCSDRFWKKGNNPEPWSGYLTGNIGQDPGYDPLDFMIRETKKRKMEFHASVNPFRINTKKDVNLPDSHPAVKNPSWKIVYGEEVYYDPSLPAVRDNALNAIEQIFKNYNVDAVHLDDYFYPYKLKENFPDSCSRNNKAQADIDNCRRAAVTDFIKRLRERITAQNNLKTTGKSYIKLGVSPFGIYKRGDKTVHPTGKYTSSAYDDLYADILGWTKNGWIDYLTPQIYWNNTHSSAPFDAVLDWWIKNTPKSVKLFIGISIDRHPPEEIKRQIEACVRRGICENRNIDVSFYRYGSFFDEDSNLELTPEQRKAVLGKRAAMRTKLKETFKSVK